MEFDEWHIFFVIIIVVVRSKSNTIQLMHVINGITHRSEFLVFLLSIFVVVVILCAKSRGDILTRHIYTFVAHDNITYLSNSDKC